jgi:hypothetical protein
MCRDSVNCNWLTGTDCGRKAGMVRCWKVPVKACCSDDGSMKEPLGNREEGRLVRESIVRIMMGTVKQPPGYGDKEE